MIEARGITKVYRSDKAGRSGVVHALRGIGIVVPDGGAVAIIGESGCGKTTLGRVLAGMETPSGGEVMIGGVSLGSVRSGERKRMLRRVQLIHQDPYSALNPTRTIEATLTDALRLHARRTGRDQSWVGARLHEVLGLVGLDPEHILPRYPHQLSGGMRQRVVIARALTVDPDVLVADEAVSMIDVSLRLGVLALLRRLRQEIGIAVLFVTHDVATARYLGEDTEVSVLYRGAVVERGLADEVITRPVHPYTQALLSAIPVLAGVEEDAPERVVPTAPLAAGQSDAGCLFEARCPFVRDECRAERPGLELVAGLIVDESEPDGASAHRHACWLPEVRQVVAVGPLAAAR